MLFDFLIGATTNTSYVTKICHLCIFHYFAGICLIKSYFFCFVDFNVFVSIFKVPRTAW